MPGDALVVHRKHQGSFWGEGLEILLSELRLACLSLPFVQGGAVERYQIWFRNPFPFHLPPLLFLFRHEGSLFPQTYSRTNPTPPSPPSARALFSHSPLGHRNRKSRSAACTLKHPAREPSFSVALRRGNARSTCGEAAKSVFYWPELPKLRPPAPRGRGFRFDPLLPRVPAASGGLGSLKEAAAGFGRRADCSFQTSLGISGSHASQCPRRECG